MKALARRFRIERSICQPGSERRVNEAAVSRFCGLWQEPTANPASLCQGQIASGLLMAEKSEVLLYSAPNCHGRAKVVNDCSNLRFR